MKSKFTRIFASVCLVLCAVFMVFNIKACRLLIRSRTLIQNSDLSRELHESNRGRASIENHSKAGCRPAREFVYSLSVPIDAALLTTGRASLNFLLISVGVVVRLLFLWLGNVNC
jgi:hypothetical protein